ncbi:MAG: ABC transporter permease [Acidobacteria bacterium]|nr:ABC transporter permease [Acidobacteriota bacterium]
MSVERIFQIFFRSVFYPLRTLSRNASLIQSMVRRDIQGRYRGSVGGTAWTLLHPLLLIAVYYFVFGVVLGVRFGQGQGSGEFLLYFICGMLPWLAFSEAVGRSPGVIPENTNFVKRVIFPLEILPVNLALTSLVAEGFALLIFLGFLITIGPGLGWTMLALPLVLIPQVMLTMGICWFLAALGVFLRDTSQVIGLLLTIWMYVTPIFYPASHLPQHWLWLFEKNPMYLVVEMYRNIFLHGTLPAVYPLAVLWAMGIAVFWFGHSWFYKVKKSFADLL